MPTFQYRARDAQGLLIAGQQEALNPDEMRMNLARRGLIPISVKKQSWDLTAIQGLFKEKVKPDEILVTTRQFHTLFKAGMNMEAVLGTLERQCTNKTLKEALRRIRGNVSSGMSLSKAFGECDKIFGELYVSMLAAGEEAGILQDVLGDLCGLLEKEIQITSSVKSATLYPKVVIFVLIAASFVIMTFVMPKFASFYGHFKATLPLPTRILIGISTFMKGYWYVVLIAAFVGWLLYNRYAKTARGKVRIGALQLSVPVFGPLNIKVSNARFCHILSALYRSGLPMNRCLEITARTIGNGAFLRDLEILMGEVTKGRMISEGMRSCKYFTPVIIDATAVGEVTGSLDEMLSAMGGHYDVEVQHTVKNLATLLEPFLLVIIFGMVTLFALAIFLPIWNMSSVVLHH